MAEGLQSPQLPEPNPVTMSVHRKQSFWQITLPLLVGVILVLIAGAGVVWAAVNDSGDVSGWSDVSVMWLIAPMLLLTIIMIAMTAAMVYVFGRLLPVLPRYTHLLLGYLVLVSRRVEGISDAAVEPFLRAHSLSASARAFRREVRRTVRGKSG